MDKLRIFVAESIGTFTLIFIGVGAIYASSIASPTGKADLLTVALAHGLAIAVMVSATMQISGGHLNPAVTLGILAGGKLKILDAIVYWTAQLCGAIVAALFCQGLFGLDAVRNGTPQLDATHLNAFQGCIIEMILTFFLVFVVWGTGVDSRGPKIGGLAIGLTITLGILFGGPFTGAAINPARSFGPALVGSLWTNHWIYWVGPMAGGALAGFIYKNLLMPEEE